MMRLIELMRATGLVDQGLRGGAADQEITAVSCDSAAVQQGALFFALPGHHTHGAAYARDALRAGAAAVVTDAEGSEVLAMSDMATKVPVIVLEHPRESMATIAASFYGHPARDVAMLGVTGTNGKTSVTHLVQTAMEASGTSCGLIGTLGAHFSPWGTREHPRTTPESPDLQRLLFEMQRDGAKAVAMEVSSIAVHEHRVDAIEFDVMGFTGLSHDHLDYHKTMESYFEAKAELFTPGRSRLGVVMIDDEWGERVAREASIPVVTVASRPHKDAQWWAVRTHQGIRIEGPEAAQLSLPIAHDFAVANALLTIAMAHTQGVPAQLSADALAQARVPGRMETIASLQDRTFVVDYAHSPDAIERVITAARADRTHGRIIIVLGAGGDRDQQKRPAMGRAAALADLVIVTDDNPRTEDPAEIRNMVRRGAELGNAEVQEIASRQEALAFAVQASQPGDIVLVVGKGHETTQDLGDRVVAFDDRQVLAFFVRQQFGSGGGERGEGE